MTTFCSYSRFIGLANKKGVNIHKNSQIKSWTGSQSWKWYKILQYFSIFYLLGGTKPKILSDSKNWLKPTYWKCDLCSYLLVSIISTFPTLRSAVFIIIVWHNIDAQWGQLKKVFLPFLMKFAVDIWKKKKKSKECVWNRMHTITLINIIILEKYCICCWKILIIAVYIYMH